MESFDFIFIWYHRDLIIVKALKVASGTSGHYTISNFMDPFWSFIDNNISHLATIEIQRALSLALRH